MKQRNHTYKFVIIIFLTFFAVFGPNKDSFAKNPTIIGFIIEAKQLEGTMKVPQMIVGSTLEEKDCVMLKLTFEDLSVKNLIIKKIIQTPKGRVTLDMTSNEMAKFQNLTLTVTNAEFSEHFIPVTGNIGLNNVKLLAHSMSTDSSSLPHLYLEFNEGSQVELEPKSKEELLNIKIVLENLLNSKTE